MQTLNQEEIVKLQPKGLITIPKKFRELLDLEENGLVKVRIEKDRLVIEPIIVLPYKVRSYTNKEIEEFFKLDNKQSKELKKSKRKKIKK
jgi:AbrB family looped-hinge helix DNA binding protein